MSADQGIHLWYRLRHLLEELERGLVSGGAGIDREPRTVMAELHRRPTTAITAVGRR
jgi:hypothetical protein